MTAKIKSEIAQLKAEIRRLQPVSSVGILTSHTQDGVIRTADPSTQPRRRRAGGPARWS